MAVARTASKSTAPKASRSAPKNSPRDVARRSPTLPAGQDESEPDFGDADEPDFGETTAAPAPAKRGPGRPAKSAPVKADPAPKAAKPRAKSGKAGGDITLTFTKVKDTGGTFQYRETDASGNVLPMGEAVMGGAYLRKALINGDLPDTFSITVHLG